MKNPKKIEALDRIFYLTGKQGISYRETPRQLQTVTPYEIQKSYTSYTLLFFSICPYLFTIMKKHLLYESNKSK